MAMRRAQAAATLVLALATFAFSAPTAGGETASPASVDVKARPDQPGDRYRFLAESMSDISGAQTIRQTFRMVFEIEVVAVKDDTSTLRYTIREIAIQDERTHIGGWARGWLDIPVAFEATPDYQPQRILNWPEVRAAFFAAVSGDQALSPADRQTIKTYIERLEARGHGAIVAELLPAISMLGELQVPRIVIGRHALPQERTPAGEGELIGEAWLEAGVPDAVRCDVTIARTKRTGSRGLEPASNLEQDLRGTISTRDGWVLALAQREFEVDGRQKRLEITTITRQGDAPGCGAG